MLPLQYSYDERMFKTQKLENLYAYVHVLRIYLSPKMLISLNENKISQFKISSILKNPFCVKIL